ncbi:hypothetical protein [Spirosoma agri]|uniref:Uncharacterized protein n=1 Tax=Spirosoma agri TaxID=1987381 RepID=A0A6M0ITG4_9BACT|nr:hypothetical protein [Spirosoma agri]NEU70951.1 hypothetical protein [Spirosoma agri]
MNPIFFFLVGLVLLFSKGAQAQNCRILYVGNDLEKPDLGDSIRYISASEAAGVLKVYYKDGRKRKIKSATVWGYTDNRHHNYRFYKGKTYKVVAIGETVKYEREEQRSVGKPVYVGNFTVNYHSTGLDGEVFSD